MTTNRRVFFIQSMMGAGALAALAMSQTAHAQGVVTDTDPQAVSLGYRTDGSKTDVKKYPNYTASQGCGGCVLFQGKATDVSGGCPIFGGKHVSSKGWCSAWAKKS
jgi:hypothetical protein